MIILKILTKLKLYLYRRDFLKFKIVKIFVYTIHAFRKNRSQVRTSALTYYTLLGIIPVMAILLGVARGFGVERDIQNSIMDKFPARKILIEQVMYFSENLLKTMNSGIIAGIGFLFLFWTVSQVLNNIEDSFNDIWQIRKSRSFVQRFTNYIAILFLVPVVIIFAKGLNGFINQNIKNIENIYFVQNIVFALLKLLPYVTPCLIFVLIYSLIPNTKVKLISSVIAGTCACTVYLVIQHFYLKFQVGVVNYNLIYGSFSALPLFLVWVRLSWLIVLSGAEFSYAIQNIEHFDFRFKEVKLSHNTEKGLCIFIYKIIIDKFKKMQSPPTNIEISEEIDIPIQLVDRMLMIMTDINMIARVINSNTEQICFQPYNDINEVDLYYLCDKIDNYGEKIEIEKISYESLAKLKEMYEKLNLEAKQSEYNVKIKEI